MNDVGKQAGRLSLEWQESVGQYTWDHGPAMTLPRHPRFLPVLPDPLCIADIVTTSNGRQGSCPSH